jgi:putative ABC transport system substrate-binding protein
MKRREFIALFGGAAAWPLAGARAQQGDRVRRIGMLMGGDPLPNPAFMRTLAGLGWIDGRNVRMDFRWPGPDINRIRALAHELVGLQPDIIVIDSTPATAALQREARTLLWTKPEGVGQQAIGDRGPDRGSPLEGPPLAQGKP